LCSLCFIYWRLSSIYGYLKLTFWYTWYQIVLCFSLREVLCSIISLM
jgi:hypothetical protein